MWSTVRTSTTYLVAMACLAACGSDSNAGNGKPAGDSGVADASSGGSSSATDGSTPGSTGGKGAGSGGTPGSGGRGTSGSAGSDASTGGTPDASAADGSVSAGGAAGLDGGPSCDQLLSCCDTTQPIFRTPCRQSALTSNAVQCSALLGFYCQGNLGDGGSVPAQDGGTGCGALALCCPNLGAQQQSCESVVNAGVPGACDVFRTSLCPP